jgi:acyl dehydratase
MSNDARMLRELTGTPITWEIRQQDLVRYSACARDFDAIHYDPEAAEAAGFDRPIAHGMFNLGLVLTRVSDATGVEAVRASTTRFRAPAHVGSRLTLQFEADGGTVLTAAVTTDGGDTVLTSRVTLGSRPASGAGNSVSTDPVGELAADRWVVVEQGPATRFAATLGAQSAELLHRDAAEAAGHPSIPVLPTFAFALPGWGFFPELPGNEEAEMPDAVRDCQSWAGTDRAVVHAGQAFHHTRPMYVGETLRARSVVTDRSTKQRVERTLAFTDVATVFTDQAGAHVVTTSMTLVVTD